MAALAVALSAMTAVTQNLRQSKAAARDKEKAAAAMAKERLAQMEAATQRIVFIDSVVVDKDSFLDEYALSADAGRLHKYNDFFSGGMQPNACVYVNGLGDRCYFSVEDTAGNFSLFTSDMFDGAWAAPTKVGGIGDEDKYKSVNYPFMMADGTTFYFAAIGDESIGGYDIFVTRYDSETGRFLKAENIGMPFNSEANDYMYAVDEFNRIGWFATDRNQEDGKVCIYAFIPSSSRQLYSPDEYSLEQIHSFATLERIADTWGDGSERLQALERLKSLQSESADGESADRMAFVINDRTVYTKPSDFRAPANVERFGKLQSMEVSLSVLGEALDKAREYYSTANDSDKNTLKGEILKTESQMETLEMQIKQLEKDIRNAENEILN